MAQWLEHCIINLQVSVRIWFMALFVRFFSTGRHSSPTGLRCAKAKQLSFLAELFYKRGMTNESTILLQNHGNTGLHHILFIKLFADGYQQSVEEVSIDAFCVVTWAICGCMYWCCPLFRCWYNNCVW